MSTSIKITLSGILLSLVLFTSCINSFLIDDKKNDNSTITLELNNSSDRTSVPMTPNFTKYKLVLKNGNSEIVHETTNRTVVLKISPGYWSLESFGFALYNDQEVIVAKSSQTFIYDPDNTQSVNIRLEPIYTGSSGTFTHQLSIAENCFPTDYSVELTGFSNNLSIISEQYNIEDNSLPSILTKNIEVLPGYYILKTTVHSEGTSYTETEAVLIAEHLTTYYTLSLDRDSFFYPVILKGSCNIDFNGIDEPILGIWIGITDQDYTTGQFFVDPQNPIWEYEFIPKKKNSSITFSAAIELVSGQFVKVDLNKELLLDKNLFENIELINTAGFIEVSGNVDFLVNDESQKVNDWEINLVNFDNTTNDRYNVVYSDVSQNKTWKFYLQKYSTEISAYLSFSGYNDDGVEVIHIFTENELICATENIKNVNLLYNPLYIGGTIEFSINNEPIDTNCIQLFCNEEDNIFYVSYFISDTGNWYFLLNPDLYEINDQIDITVSIEEGGLSLKHEFKNICIVGTEPITNLDLLWNFSLTPISGTISLTSNSSIQDFTNFNLYFYSSPVFSHETFLGNTILNSDGTWSNSFEMNSEEIDVYMELEYNDSITTLYSQLNSHFTVKKNEVNVINTVEEIIIKQLSGEIINFETLDFFQIILCKEKNNPYAFFGITYMNNPWDIDILNPTQNSQFYIVITSSTQGHFITNTKIDLNETGFTGIILDKEDMIPYEF